MNLILDQNKDAPGPLTCSPGQVSFFYDWTSTHCGFRGGWGSGKSHVGAIKLITLHLINSFDLSGQPTYVPSCILAPTYSTLFKVNVPFVQSVAEEMNLKVEIKKPTGDMGALIYFPDLSTSKHSSVIYLISADSTKNIIGFEAGASWIDECSFISDPGMLDPKNSPLTQIEGRVRSHKARMLQRLYTWTPEGTGTYIEKKFSSNLPGHTLHQGSTKDNPYVRETYLVQKATFNAEMVSQYLDGIPGEFNVGQAYPYFGQTNIKDIDFHFDQPLCITWDFGASPGNTLLLGSYNGAELVQDRVLHIVEEFHKPKFDLKTALIEFEKWIKVNRHRFKCISVFGDAAGIQKSAHDNNSSYTLIENKLKELKLKYKMKVNRKNPSHRARINAINCACDGDKPHFYVHPRCHKLIQDFKDVMLDDKAGIDKSAKQRLNTHLTDAAGYFITKIRPVHREREQTKSSVVFQKVQ